MGGGYILNVVAEIYGATKCPRMQRGGGWVVMRKNKRNNSCPKNDDEVGDARKQKMTGIP